MNFIITLLILIIILGIIVFIHELGNFLAAKKMGVYVHEFAIGMGPKIFSFKRKNDETRYSIRLLPLGGFTALASDNESGEGLKKNQILENKTAFQRFLIMFFGAGNNFISAILIIFIIGLFFGSTSMKPVITTAEKGYPAYEAGISAGDVVKEINGHKISYVDDITLYLAVSDPTKNITIKVEKENGSIETYKFKPMKVKENGQEVYRYGIGMKQEKQHGFVNALVYTGKKTASIFKQMAITVSYLFTGGIKLSQLSGPVGIYSVVGEQSKAGIASILYLVAFLSINVGFINLLPLPAFDGGHILFIIIEKIKGSPVDSELEGKIHTIGLMLLMLLMVVVTVNDILRLF